MSSYSILIFLSLIVILSYSFNLLARRWRVPPVLLLLAVGILLHYGGNYLKLGFKVNNINPYLELFGIVGLILIVLEAALDIKISVPNLPNIRKSLEVALLVLLLGIVCIGWLFHFWFDTGWRAALVNSVPLAVISSAIVIPSIIHLGDKKREFLTYEAAFSDILGILIFNFLVHKAEFSVGSFFSFFGVTLVTIIVSLGSAILLIYLALKIKDHVKMFIILSIMMLLYSLGKMLHLSALFLIFIFGILLNNFGDILKNKLTEEKINELTNELSQFKLIVAESSFIVRTFFFVIFGYSIDLFGLANLEVVLIGFVVMIVLLEIRFLYLRFIAKVELLPELFVAPRGLVSILLFYDIPSHLLISSISKGVIFFVICVSSILMAVGLYLEGAKKKC